MVEIRVTKERPNRAEAVGVSSEVVDLLDKAMSFEIEGSFFQRRAAGFRFDGKRHLFSKVTNRFPAGLISLAKETLAKAKVEHCVVDTRQFGLVKKVRADVLRDITLADHQLEAVRAVLSNRGGILRIATNGGKTAIACALVACLPSRSVLWIVPSRALVKQAVREIQRFTGIQAGQIQGGQFEPGHVTVACAPSLSVKGRDTVAKLRRKRISDYLRTVGVLIADEVHHGASTSWNKPLSSCKAPWRIGLSGTPLDRSDGKNMLVEALCGPVVARVTNKHLIDIGWSARPTIEVHEVDKPALPDNLSWQDAYKLGIVRNNHRNNIIARRAVQAMASGQGVLILCREIEHVQTLGDFLGVHGCEEDRDYVCVWAGCERQEEKLEAFAGGHVPVLVASPFLGEGVDLPGDHVRVLVNAEGLESVILTLQKLGRSLRRKTKGDNSVRVVEFADLINRHLAKHSIKRLDTYKSEGFKILTV